MQVSAPYCQYKKTNFKIYIVILLIAAVYFAYDGYLNKNFIKKHTTIDQPDSTLAFNKKSPPFFVAGAVILAVWFWMVKDKKLVADDEALVFSEKDKIPYDSIESINKTNYDSKGLFIVEYKLPNGQKSQREVSSNTYDNLAPILELLVSKITG
ncbi:MAG: hypothetical protein ABSE89_11845 [Sedimentisphaerales bacterium]